MIEIVIDELVVHGLPRDQAHAAAAALESRLALLAGAADATVPARAESYRRLATVAPRAGSPGAIGDAVAGAVWGAVSGGRSR